MINAEVKNLITKSSAILTEMNCASNTIEVLSELVLANVVSKLNPRIARSIAHDNKNTSDVIGYEIKNVGDFTIKNIQLPQYALNPRTKKFEGDITEVDLKPNEVLFIPTKWLMLLLSRVEYLGKVKNGQMRITKADSQQVSLDDYFGSCVFSKRLPQKAIGIIDVATHKAQVAKYFTRAFGYLSNESKIVDIKINKSTDNIAILLGIALREAK